MNLRKAGSALLGITALLLLVGVALAQGTLSVDWWVIGGGGGHSQAAPYALDGTVGQAVAETVSNGGYTLCAGFWCGAEAAAAAEYNIYLPVVMKNHP